MRTVLSLFPGLGLLDRAFEEAGFQIVRGPDIIWGGDVRTFRGIHGVCGVIGGPPCQKYSTASEVGPGTKAVDLIGEFVRIVEECTPAPSAPLFVVMENVPRAANSSHIPLHWHQALLNDWDCGGLTGRKRSFWTWPFNVKAPAKRPVTQVAKPSLSVMASSYKRGKTGNPFLTAKGYLAGDLPVARYGELQGYEPLALGLEKAGFSRRTIIHLLGNGVPKALGTYVAQYAKAFIDSKEATS